MIVNNILLLFCFIIWEADCKDQLFFMELCSRNVETTALKNWKLSYQSYFHSVTAELLVFLMFDIFQTGRAAIHYAAIGGHLNIVKFLIENGADPNIKNTEVRKISQIFCLDSNSLIMYFWNVK